MQIQSTFLRSDEGLVQDARDSGSFVTKPTTLHVPLHTVVPDSYLTLRGRNLTSQLPTRYLTY